MDDDKKSVGSQHLSLLISYCGILWYVILWYDIAIKPHPH